MKIIKYILISGLALILISSCVKSCERGISKFFYEYYKDGLKEMERRDSLKRLEKKDSLRRLEEKSKDLKISSEYDK